MPCLLALSGFRQELQSKIFWVFQVFQRFQNKIPWNFGKDFKTSKKKTRKEASVDISNWMTNRYIRCVIDTDHNKHYVYIKAVKFLNQRFHITILLVWCEMKHFHVSLKCNTYCAVSKHPLRIRLILKAMFWKINFGII